MNSSSAVTTGAAGVSAAMLAGVITWLCSWPIQPPPADVSMGLAALALAAGHGLWNFVSARWPAKTVLVAVTPVPPVTQPTTTGTSTP
jgi:hypothetical protein